ncbi:MAG: hypothetical protein OEM18_08225 [Nitrosopumilus sp.]|nr:hypothetical protein [Nitrosopumilus sp.]MDH3502040.1 hypothetical protein [Nitrosopumilus sp.]
MSEIETFFESIKIITHSSIRGGSIPFRVLDGKMRFIENLAILFSSRVLKC